MTMPRPDEASLSCLGGHPNARPMFAIVRAPADTRGRRLGRAAQDSIEDMMRALEPWSMELQRHCPDDWNQCSSILVQCLTRPGDELAGRGSRVVPRRPNRSTLDLRISF